MRANHIAAAAVVRAASIILPVAMPVARNTAGNCIPPEIGLAKQMAGGNVETVVAGLPQGSGTPRPYRYPSPFGRRCDCYRAPPFFYGGSKGYANKRDFAHSQGNGVRAFDGGVFLASYCGIKNIPDKRGRSPCSEYSNHNPKRCSSFSPCRHLPLAVRIWARRPLSAVAPDWALLPCWTATLPLARWSARPVTLRIASPSRNAAGNRHRPQGASNIHLGTIRAGRRGWSLPFSASALRRGACI